VTNVTVCESKRQRYWRPQLFSREGGFVGGPRRKATRARLLKACSKLVGTNELALLDYLWHARQAPARAVQRVEHELAEALDKGPGYASGIVRALRAATKQLKDATDGESDGRCF
jgi:hypothetical protein